MSANIPSPNGVAVSATAAIGSHVLRVLQDPGFQTVVKRDGWRFVVSVAAEARAAWVRT
jgi:hypothetical protein